ncbi:hypothetical protein J007_06356 [Cryptococcus neoformans]|nr:hypothetical protein C356_06436 [Cryptococcus neoformans var. grubii c45]OXB33973.1 hypothetical protein J007_06356 [Cryptococcus neoformans var. grubii]OXC58118.1 hypothetical protein C358_06450 [Cryptococcus neoformans var. grubii MW-RSA852]
MSFVDEIDWDQFLVDTDLGDKNTNVSPATSISTLSSDQSAALDPQPINFGFGMGAFNSSPSTGITHRLENMLPVVSPEVTDDQLTTSFGLFTGFDTGAFTQPATTPAAGDSGAELLAAISQLVGSSTSSSPSAVEPLQLSLPPTPDSTTEYRTNSNKRKASDASDEGAPAPKRRGRPPGTGKPKAAKPMERQQSKTSSFSSSSPSSFNGTPPADDSDLEAASPTVKVTATGKPSTDRPKSVVPAKFLKDGTAQAILGMTIPEILSFPTYEELLKKVKVELLPGAREFGEKIADNRDKAKDAAKKSRDERRAKIERAEYFEKKCEQLQEQIASMSSFLMTLVELNVLKKDQIQAFV